jgi:hypothetical protein
MSLGKRKSSGGNSFMPVFKFDARNGAFYLEERVQGANGWEKQQTDITDRFEAVFDLANVERGWIKFPRGAPPETVLVPAGHDPGEAPSEDHKEGFRVLVQVDGVVHEFMSTSLSAWKALDALHNAFERERDTHPGQLPVVKLHDVIERRYASGPSFEPSFVIHEWVPRPDELKQRKHTDLDDEVPFD